MKEKIKKIIYEYTEDSRQTTKEIGKKTGTSQQSAFYLINTLKEKGEIITETTIIDPLKIGYQNTLIGFNYLKLDYITEKKVIETLKSIPEVVGIEASKKGFDLLIEISTKNLGLLDQLHREISSKLKKEIATAFIFPIISKFIYDKKYLRNTRIPKQKVLFGNRDYINLSENEKNVLKELVKYPTKKLIDIAADLNINVKSVTKAKKELEKKLIIKGYSAVLDHKELGIKREIIFLRMTGEGNDQIQKIIDYAKQHKNIVEAIKVIGSSHVVLVVENLKEIDIIREIRSNFSTQNYMIFDSEKVHKRTYLPIED